MEQKTKFKAPPAVERFKYRNVSHQKLLEAIEAKKIPLKWPVMITADQFSDTWSVSVGYVSTGIHIPKDELFIDELLMVTDDDFGGRVVVNSVWRYNG